MSAAKKGFSNIKKGAAAPSIDEVVTPQEDREEKLEEQKRKPRRKISKTTRIFEEHNAIIQEQAFMRSKEGHGRVSEADVLAEALDLWCEAMGIDPAEYR